MMHGRMFFKMDRSRIFDGVVIGASRTFLTVHRGSSGCKKPERYRFAALRFLGSDAP